MDTTHALMRAKQRLGLHGDNAAIARQIHKLCQSGRPINAREAYKLGATRTDMDGKYVLVRHNGRRYVIVLTEDGKYFITILPVKKNRSR